MSSSTALRGAREALLQAVILFNEQCTTVVVALYAGNSSSLQLPVKVWVEPRLADCRIHRRCVVLLYIEVREGNTL